MMVAKKRQILNQKNLVLAALSPAKGGSFKPVQIQKLFFLIDENLGEILGGKYFSFEPYDYGPFDKEVYRVLEGLEGEGLVEIFDEPSGRLREYKLTPEGQEQGEANFKKLPPGCADYIKSISDAVRTLSFSQLVSAIYREYPGMKVNSVFSE